MQETGVSYCIRGENDLLLFTLFSLKSGVTAEINPPYIIEVGATHEAFILSENAFASLNRYITQTTTMENSQ